MRVLLRLSAVLIGVWLLLCVAAGIVAVEAALHPGRRLVEPKAEAAAQAIALRNQAELAEFLGVPDRTLARRREKGALTKVESERFARLVEIFNACMELFHGNSDAAVKAESDVCCTSSNAVAVVASACAANHYNKDEETAAEPSPD